MSKTILAEVDGWTPLIDDISRNYSLITSAVFGRIWRYCQGNKGVCVASLETISYDLGLDKATVMRHAKKLVEAGYLNDLTPGLRHAPHTYSDTGKAGIRIKVEGVAHSNDQNKSVAQCNTSVAESKLKKELRKNQFKRQGKKQRTLFTSALCAEGETLEVE